MCRKNSIIILLLIICSCFYISQVSVCTGNTIQPAWSYIAEEKNDIVLDGSLTDWSDVQLSSVTLFNSKNPKEELSIDLYFCYNETNLYCGTSIPDDLGTVHGLEVIFFGVSGVYDGVVIDADKQEGYDEAFPHRLIIRKDIEIGGEENTKSASVISSDKTVFEFAKSISSDDERGLDFSLNEGDSIAVICQAWIGKSIEEKERPNFSTIGNYFNYLRLSINQDEELQLFLFYPTMHTADGGDLESYFIVDSLEFESTLDGQRNEEYWYGVPFHISNFAILEFQNIEKENIKEEYSTDQTSIYREVRISMINDHDDILVYLEIENIEPKIIIEDIFISFGKDEDYLNRIDSINLVSKINKEEHIIYSGNRSDFNSVGFMEDEYAVFDYLNIPYYREPEHYGLFEADSSPIIYSNVEGDEYWSVEFTLPFLKSPSLGGLFSFNFAEGDVCIMDMTLNVTPVNPADPYNYYYMKDINLEEDIIKIITHRINFSVEPEDTTTTDFPIGLLSTVTSMILTIVIIQRYRSKNQRNVR